MKKVLFFLSFVISTITTFSQLKVGKNPKNIDSSALLQIDADQTVGLAKGLLLPRVPLIGLFDSTTIPKPAIGLAVYAQGGLLARGLYTWNGTQWVTASVPLGLDTTNDPWVNNAVRTRVELGTTSTGASRAFGNNVVITDAGNVAIGDTISNTKLLVLRRGASESGNWIAQFGNTSARISLAEENGVATRNGVNTASLGPRLFYSAANTATIESSQGSIALIPMQIGQRIGLHTYNPIQSVHIDGAADNPGAGGLSTTQAANDFVFTNQGRLGVGLTNPTNKLHVAGNALFTPYTGNDGTGEPVTMEIYGRVPTGLATQVGGIKFGWYNLAYGGMEVIRGVATNGLGLAFNYANLSNQTTEGMRLSYNGNFSIGTTSESGLLNLKVDSAAGSTTNMDFLLKNSTNVVARIQGLKSNTSTTGILNFFTTANNGSLLERMRIDSNGYIGIGTSLMNSKLHINGSIATANVSTIAATYNLTDLDHTVSLNLAGAQTLTFPAASACDGREYVILNTTSTIKTFGNSVITLDNVATTLLFPYTTYTIKSINSSWKITHMSSLPQVIVLPRVYGAASLSPAGTTAATASDYLTINIPYQGTWSIEYTINGAAVLANSGIAAILTNASNVVVGGSEQCVIYSPTASVRTNSFNKILVTTTGAATYKVRVFSMNVASGGSVYNIGTGSSWVTAQRLY